MLSGLYSNRLKRTASVIGVFLMMGCGFDAVLKSPGPAAVSFVFTDTVLTNGSCPDLIAFTYNPNVVGVSAGDDSLIARHIGIDSINIRFQSTLRAATADTVIRIRVKV